VLAEMAEAWGGITDPPQTVGDCADWEDNRILDLAAAVGAFLIVSADADLTGLPPWRGALSLSRRSSRHWSMPHAGHADAGESRQRRAQRLVNRVERCHLCPLKAVAPVQIRSGLLTEVAGQGPDHCSQRSGP